MKKEFKSRTAEAVAYFQKSWRCRKTILVEIPWPYFTNGAPIEEENEHSDIGRDHFVKYCDTNKCVLKNNFLVGGWHDYPCKECKFNPYIMQKKAGIANKEGSPTRRDDH